MQVVHVNLVLDGEVAVFVGRAVGHTAFDAAAGHPHRKTEGVVVAARGVRIGMELRRRGAPEFSAPNDERVLEKAPRLEVIQ